MLIYVYDILLELILNIKYCKNDVYKIEMECFIEM